MTAQLDLFATTAPADPRVSPAVELSDVCKCGGSLAQIGPGSGPHCASLRCASCGAHRGWLSEEAYRFVSRIIERFGPLTAPIKIRRGERISNKFGMQARMHAGG